MYCVLYKHCVCIVVFYNCDSAAHNGLSEVAGGQRFRLWLIGRLIVVKVSSRFPLSSGKCCVGYRGSWVVYRSTIFCGTTFSRTILYRTIFCSIIFFGTTFCGTIFCGTIFCGTIFCGTTFCGTIFCGTTFCGTIFCCLRHGRRA